MTNEVELGLKLVGASDFIHIDDLEVRGSVPSNRKPSLWPSSYPPSRAVTHPVPLLDACRPLRWSG